VTAALDVLFVACAFLAGAVFGMRLERRGSALVARVERQAGQSALKPPAVVDPARIGRPELEHALGEILDDDGPRATVIAFDYWASRSSRAKHGRRPGR